MTTWIIRTVQFEDVPIKTDCAEGYLLLLCSEYDCSNYYYRYLSQVPGSIAEIIALAVHENSNHWICDWYKVLKDDDKIAHFGNDIIVEFSSIKEQVNSKIVELEQEEFEDEMEK